MIIDAPPLVQGGDGIALAAKADGRPRRHAPRRAFGARGSRSSGGGCQDIPGARRSAWPSPTRSATTRIAGAATTGPSRWRGPDKAAVALTRARADERRRTSPLRQRLGAGRRIAGAPGHASARCLSGFAGQAVLVVSGVIAARMLGPEDRGYLALLVLVPLIVAQVGGLGDPAGGDLLHRPRPRRPRRASGRRSGRWCCSRQGCSPASTASCSGRCCRDDPQYVIDAALYTVLLVPAALAQEYGLALLQGRGRFTAFNVLRLTPVVIYAAGVTVLLRDGPRRAQRDRALVWTGANVVLGALTMAVALGGHRACGRAAAPIPRSEGDDRRSAPRACSGPTRRSSTTGWTRPWSDCS